MDKGERERAAAGQREWPKLLNMTAARCWPKTNECVINVVRQGEGEGGRAGSKFAHKVQLPAN